jgi:hypothetical protein
MEYVAAPFNIPVGFAIELQKAGELLDVGNRAQEIGQAVLEEMQTSEIDSDYKFVGFFILNKALKSLQSVQVLCRCGYGSDGFSICAVLFENLIDLLFIGHAPVKQARRFCQFESVEKYYQIQKVLAAKRLPKGRRAKYKEYEKRLLPDVLPLLKYFPKRSKGWSQTSLLDRAKRVKAALDYQELYWIFCAHKHTLPFVAPGISIQTAAGNLAFTNGPDMKGICYASEQSAELFLKICLVLAREFNLSTRTEIESCLVAIQNAVRSVRIHHPELFK